MRKYTVAMFLSLLTVSAAGQITITNDDMPSPGDTVRLSRTLVLEGIGYQETGEGITWDFSGLTVMSQDVDTFASPGEAPLAYQLVFNNPVFYPDHKATVAERNSGFDFIPDMDLSAAFLFYKGNDVSFSEIGAGVTINGIPLTLPYEQFDVKYQFPLTYGQGHSSTAVAGLDVPGLGSFSFTRSRDVTAEGWGTLVTPYGSFEAIKLRSEIYEYDSLYLDSLQTGFPLHRYITEYSWLASGFSRPLLTVTEEGFAVSAAYVDSARSAFLEVNEIPYDRIAPAVYPNPATDHFNISYELTEPEYVSIEIFSLRGDRVLSQLNRVQQRGIYSRIIYTDSERLSRGTYILRVRIGDELFARRIIIN